MQIFANYFARIMLEINILKVRTLLPWFQWCNRSGDHPSNWCPYQFLPTSLSRYHHFAIRKVSALEMIQSRRKLRLSMLWAVAVRSVDTLKRKKFISNVVEFLFFFFFSKNIKIGFKNVPLRRRISSGKRRRIERLPWQWLRGRRDFCTRVQNIWPDWPMPRLDAFHLVHEIAIAIDGIEGELRRIESVVGDETVEHVLRLVVLRTFRPTGGETLVSTDEVYLLAEYRVYEDPRGVTR